VQILAIHAHPDDLEFLAAGTLAILARAGHKITMATMTAGDCGSAEFDAEEASRIRRAEAASSASIIGARYMCAEFRDLAIFNDDASRRRVTELIRGARPQVVLTASPIDYHTDHEFTSMLVRDACFACSAPNYGTGSAEPAPALDAIPHLYFADPLDGVDREGVPQPVNFFVDIGTVIGLKRDMLACHASQRAWLKRQHGIDEYMEAMMEWTRKVGRRAGVEFAEGFRHYRGHPYPQNPLLEEALREVKISSNADAVL
jgi:LmbE family N-acetylglucosaminyl deacetylase